MKDVRVWLDRLRTQAEECRLISKLATNKAKRETFASLAETYDKAAEALQVAIDSGNIPGELGI
jgi:hypothetical protein